MPRRNPHSGKAARHQDAYTTSTSSLNTLEESTVNATEVEQLNSSTLLRKEKSITMLFIAKLWMYDCIQKDNQTTTCRPSQICEQPPLADCGRV